MVEAFAGEGAEADALALLFAETFDRIDKERSQVIGGIARYAKKQTTLSARIEGQADAVAEIEARTNLDDDELDRLEEMQDALDWDTRIWEERQRALTYVCETPVILERRAFMIAREIATYLPD